MPNQPRQCNSKGWKSEDEDYSDGQVKSRKGNVVHHHAGCSKGASWQRTPPTALTQQGQEEG